MKIHHHCKFCSAKVILEMDETLFAFCSIEDWKAMAACNRCADFLVKKHRIIDSVGSLVIRWVRHRSKHNVLESEELSKLRSSLSDCLKKFAAHICEFYRAEYTFDDDFTTKIMDSPHLFGKVMKVYEKGIAKIVGKPFVIAGRHYEHYETEKVA